MGFEAFLVAAGIKIRSVCALPLPVQRYDAESGNVNEGGYLLTK
ncbi:hypothetical protein HMPREF6485_1552 [Segatella buccae ATCC 33574]|uniref:Uncharacterized protein n=1 Tax=Segatella buccae ATCC 33574 TaxID=873513 RepID=E6K7X3_9BACT|nr:hypothetical protein HMPREF6485_1552 [Segatella buccae ATCC 33574]